MKCLAQIIIIIFAVVLPKTIYAQLFPLDEERYVDSLTQKLSSKIPDSEKARIDFYLLDYWAGKDTLKASAYLNNAKALIGHNTFLNALFYFYTASSNLEKDEAKRKALLLKADSLLQKVNTSEALSYRGLCWSYYAVIIQLQDDEKGALDILINKCIPLVEKSDDKVQLGKFYIDVGEILSNEGQKEKATEYYTNGLNILRSNHAPPYLFVYGYLRVAYNWIQGNGRHDLPLGKKYLDSANALLKPYPKSHFYINYYSFEGSYYRQTNQYTKGLNSLDKGMRLAEYFSMPYEAFGIKLQQYKIYTDMGNFKAAKRTLLDIISHRGTYPKHALNEMNLYYFLGETYYQLGDMRNAFIAQRRCLMILDSLYDSNITNAIAEMDAKYRTSEKEKKILTLQAEKDKASLQSQKQKATNHLLLISGAFLAALIGSAILYYKKISQQKLNEINQQHQLNIAQALLTGEDRERKRLARDLHDGLGGMLAGVKLNLSSMGNNHHDFAHENGLNRVINQLDGSISELRRIARNMMPEALLKLGLEKALKDLCDFYASTLLQISFQAMNIAKDISVNNQIYIYRIIQELISNAVKHAHAAHIFVQCSQNKGLFLITVEDDGKGFDTGLLNSRKGLGWSNIKNRVAFLKGKTDIRSQKGEGTIVNIELNCYAG